MKRFTAVIKIVEGDVRSLGSFETAEEAQAAFAQAKAHYFNGQVSIAKMHNRSVANFHRKRTPFFLSPNGFIYVTEKFAGTHETWAKVLGLPAEAMEDWPRGYFWRPTNCLYFYVGGDTREYRRAIGKMRRAISEVLMKTGGNDCTMIHGGMNPGEPGQVWESVHCFGTRDDFLASPSDLEIV